MRKSILYLSFCALVFLFCGTYVQADVISYEDPDPETYDETNTSLSHTFTLEKFDSSLGTLESVLFTWDATIDGTLSVIDPGIGTYTLNNLTADSLLDVPGGGGGYWTDSTDPPAGLPQQVDSNTTWDLLSKVIDREQTFTEASELAWFTGTASDTFTLNFLGYLNISKDAVGPWAENQTTSLSGGKVAVSYTYSSSPIPEPATIALFGVGLIGVARISKRKFIKT